MCSWDICKGFWITKFHKIWNKQIAAERLINELKKHVVTKADKMSAQCLKHFATLSKWESLNN